MLDVLHWEWLRDVEAASLRAAVDVPAAGGLPTPRVDESAARDALKAVLW